MLKAYNITNTHTYIYSDFGMNIRSINPLIDIVLGVLKFQFMCSLHYLLNPFKIFIFFPIKLYMKCI